jgi:hypothetical protein
MKNMSMRFWVTKQFRTCALLAAYLVMEIGVMMDKSMLRSIIKEEVSAILTETTLREKLIEKAKQKEKDGIFSYDGVIYRVKNSRLTHYCKGGRVLEVNGYFDVSVGSYTFAAEAKKMLKDLR